MSHEWFHRTAGMFGSVDEVGPIQENDFVALAMQGKLKRDSLVRSPTRTSNNWFTLTQIAGLNKALERQAAKEAEAQKKTAARQEAAEVRAAQTAAQVGQQQAAHQQQSARASQVSHCPNAALVDSMCQKVQAILTSQEVIQYVAVQQKPLVNISPDALVATNRRLIFFRSKLLGRFEFQDYLWFDLSNAHVQQNLLGSVFSARHVSGQVLTMDYPTAGHCAAGSLRLWIESSSQ